MNILSQMLSIFDPKIFLAKLTLFFKYYLFSIERKKNIFSCQTILTKFPYLYGGKIGNFTKINYFQWKNFSCQIILTKFIQLHHFDEKRADNFTKINIHSIPKLPIFGPKNFNRTILTKFLQLREFMRKKKR